MENNLFLKMVEECADGNGFLDVLKITKKLLRVGIKLSTIDKILLDLCEAGSIMIGECGDRKTYNLNPYIFKKFENVEGLKDFFKMIE